MNSTVSDLEQIFHPRSVSIIGASSREGSFGRMFLEGLIRIGFREIYPVHPRETELLGLRAYQGIKDIPHDVDVAILMTPPDSTLQVVQDCAEKGMKGIVVFTAGFGEKGAEGKKIEQEICRVARTKNIRVIGPNSIGIYCPTSKLLTFPQGLMHDITTEGGPVGSFSHSGSFVDYLTYILTKKGIRFSKVISCGNECDLNAVDFLEYFGQDKQTKIIISYLEGIKNGRRFFELAREITKEKPIIVWKGGATELGAKAAMSHTGSLAGEKHVWEAMFEQTGIISVRSFEEIVDCLFCLYYLPLPRGRRIAVVAGMGGTNVGTADNCIELGLEMARLSGTTLERLAKLLPPVGTSVGNPTDIGVATLVAPNLYGETLKILNEDENVDMLLAISDPGRPCTQSIVEAAKIIKKPLAVTLFALPEFAAEEYAFLAQNNIATFGDAKRAVAALAKVSKYASYNVNR
ncbi:MAG: CoA-binding protein [Dehalococcoidia bacterium]|nr:CoA-binding protein [Dehalococcoidia bacterium]